MARGTLFASFVQSGQPDNLASRGMNYPTHSCYWDRISQGTSISFSASWERRVSRW